MTNTEKSTLRETLLDKRNSLDEQTFSTVSASICEALNILPLAQKARNIAAYMSVENEIDLSGFMTTQLGVDKHLYLPKYQAESDTFVFCEVKDIEDDCNIGKYNIPEPRDHCPILSETGCKQLIHIWLVPCVGFTTNGYRIGRGKGIYDQLLKGSQGQKIGVAYDWQKVDHFPTDDWDIPLDLIITEKEIYGF